MELVSLLEIGEWAMKHIKRPKILLAVEDNGSDEKLLRDVIESINIKCDFAATGEDALILMRKARYSVALIDLNLPKMSGKQLSQRISDIQPDVKIFFTTGSREIALEEGETISIVRKPVTAHALRKMML